MTLLTAHLSDVELQALAEADQAQVTVPPHLVACAECREAVALYAQLGRDIRASPRPLPPSDFTASLLARLPPDPPALSTDDLFAAALAAGAALIAGLLFLRADGLPQLIDLFQGFPGRAVTEGLVAACLAARDQVALLVCLPVAALVLGAALWRVMSRPRQMFV